MLSLYFFSHNPRFTVGEDPRWCCTYLLDATDPLFVEIGKAFIEEQLKGELNFLHLDSREKRYPTKMVSKCLSL